MRFGLDDGQIRTLEEVGRAFGVTRERIRQIEAQDARQAAPPTRVRSASKNTSMAPEQARVSVCREGGKCVR